MMGAALSLDGGRAMASLDETGAAGGGGNSLPDERTTPTPLELRVRQLESENASLRAELADVKAKHAVDASELQAHRMFLLPATAAEFERRLATAVDMSDVLTELAAELERAK
jgi:predicted component of type VI protein secretion system